LTRISASRFAHNRRPVSCFCASAATDLAEADDQVIWAYAKANGFTIVSHDVDFAEMATLLGHPPKVVWLRTGNCASLTVVRLLREYADVIRDFERDDTLACLELYDEL
jgi:predicted nuclease of predicted toxin-antitoxin system